MNEIKVNIQRQYFFLSQSSCQQRLFPVLRMQSGGLAQRRERSGDHIDSLTKHVDQRQCARFRRGGMLARSCVRVVEEEEELVENCLV